jgi:hypothetical protein
VAGLDEFTAEQSGLDSIARMELGCDTMPENPHCATSGVGTDG